MQEILKSGAVKLNITLSPEQLSSFESYYHELIAANRQLNLTAITEYKEVQAKHFLDSLTALPVIASVNAVKSCNIIDVGAGAGLPGIPLKIALPEISLTLLEATVKKAAFLERVAGALKLTGVAVVALRAETAARDPLYREKYDVALSRAVASLPALAELALPFCRVGGLFIAYKKGDIRKEISDSQKAIDLMGGRLKEVVPVSSELFADERCLVVVEKVGPTPPGYPRRPGMPEKRPVL